MPANYWDGFARAYGALGAPLKPSDHDIRFMQTAVFESFDGDRSKQYRGIVLGVTPGIAEMRWPERFSLVAIDNSYAMTRSVWAGNIDGERSVVCGDWLRLPCGSACCDVVIGDGSINCLEYPAGFHGLACVTSGALRGDGRLILRCYLQLERPESVDAIFDAALRGEIASFHAFKLRLLMALQKDARQGVVVDDVYRVWANWRAGDKRLPTGPGWEAAAVETIEYYRGVTTRYAFATLDELRGTLLPFFDEISICWPGYELGERCPTLVLCPRRAK